MMSGTWTREYSLLLFKYLPHIGTIVKYDGALFDVRPLPRFEGLVYRYSQDYPCVQANYFFLISIIRH